MKPFLQPGAQVIARFRARAPDQLGSASLEPVGEGPSALFDDRLALAGLSAAAAVAAGALPERELHPGAYLAFEALTQALAHPDIWPAVFVRFEAGLLQDLGFGLDLSKCAATGAVDDLIYVSPRTGRAVSREAGAPYQDRLLALPPFLLGAQAGLGAGDVGAGLALTGHFLEAFIFNPLNRPLPPARIWLVERLADAGRL
jgi:DNA repair protein RecO (recombination protein O)